MAFLIGALGQSVYPVAPVRDGIVFPGTENVLVFGRAKSVAAINEALRKRPKSGSFNAKKSWSKTILKVMSFIRLECWQLLIKLFQEIKVR